LTKEKLAEAMREAETTTFFGKRVSELSREELIYGLIMYAKKEHARFEEARRRQNNW
jgi:hypothetical protein